MDFPKKKNIGILPWIFLVILTISMSFFIVVVKTRGATLSVFGGPQAPVEGWTSGHKYKTVGISLHTTQYRDSHVEFETGLTYQKLQNGATADVFALDLRLTTRGTLFAGFNAGFGHMSKNQIVDVGDIPCHMVGHFGPAVGYWISERTAIELRLDHVSAFTPHDKGRNHAVIGLRWRL